MTAFITASTPAWILQLWLDAATHTPDWIVQLQADADAYEPEWIRQLRIDADELPTWQERLAQQADKTTTNNADVRVGDVWESAHRTFRITWVTPTRVFTATVGGRSDGRKVEVMRSRFTPAPYWGGYRLVSRTATEAGAA